MEVIDEVVLVSDDEIRASICLLALENKLVAEGSGAMTLAAALNTPIEERGRTVCLFTGGIIYSDKNKILY
ncbi:pyridoxal-phosphate dependent enzyme [Candidatus Bathyarchaeota archaeon]|nr:pyridoxal-phosphate dependent enzyme [Candidatus Bathyarchaeota archaeon]